MDDPQKKSYIIFAALLVSQLMFLAVAFSVERSVEPVEGISPEILLIVGSFMVLSLMTLSHFTGRKLMDAAMRLSTPAERIEAAMRALAVRLALLESGGILSLVMYLFTGEPTFVVMFALVLMMFVYRRPSSEEWDNVRRGQPTV